MAKIHGRRSLVYLHFTGADLMFTLIHVRILETVHTAFMLRQIYYYTIIGFGDFVAISKIDW